MNEGEIAGGLDFGRAKSIIENTSDNPLTQLLLELTNELIVDLQKELTKNDSYATGNLFSSIIPTKIDEKTIDVTAPYYWKYVNYGVNGTKINRGAPNHGPAPKTEKTFYQAIKKWLYDKGIQPPEGITIEQYAGMVKNSIRMKGIEATHFYDKVVTPERVREMSVPISNLLKQSIITIINKPKT